MSEVTATITTPADGTLAVCLACKAELRTDWPGTLQTFRTWHQQHCGGSNARTETRPDLVECGRIERPRGEGTPGAMAQTYKEVEA